MAERVDLDALERLANAADRGAYQAQDITDIVWDDPTGKPRLWWVDRPGWIDNADAEALCYSEADARFAVAARPATVLALVAELRVAREVVNAGRRVARSPDVIGDSEPAAQRLFDLGQAVRAYDLHADPSTHDRSGSG